MSQMVTCAACGFRYDPDGRSACPACPLNPTCKLSCCPNCGVSNMLVEQSSWVQRIKRLIGAHHHDPVIPEQS